MLEIHQRYIVDDAGTSIAVQIPIAQFKTLLEILRDQEEIAFVTEDIGLSTDELQEAATIKY